LTGVSKCSSHSRGILPALFLLGLLTGSDRLEAYGAALRFSLNVDGSERNAFSGFFTALVSGATFVPLDYQGWRFSIAVIAGILARKRHMECVMGFVRVYLMLPMRVLFTLIAILISLALIALGESWREEWGKMDFRGYLFNGRNWNTTGF
jgi:hypothetical protein